MESNINRDKLNNYAEKVADRLCQDFFTEGKHISGQEILKFSEIEQLNLLVLKNLYLKWNEESLALKSPYFDYDSDSVKRAMKEFLNVLSRNISVGKDAFHPILTISIEELVVLVNDFKVYMQYYVIDKSVSADLMEGTTKFYKIYARSFRLSSSMLFKSRHPDVNALPSSFLPDKEEQEATRQKVMSVLEGILPLSDDIFIANSPDNNSAQINESEDEDTNAPLTRPQKPIIPKDEQRNVTVQPTTDTVATHEERSDEISDPDISGQSETESKKPLEKDMVTETETGIDQPSFDHVEEEQNIKPVLNDRFSEQKESLVDKHRSLRGESLRSVLSLNQKFMFIHQLFKGNAQEFEHSLVMIEGSHGFQEALEKVKSAYADQYGWNFENEEETEFLEVISRRFK